MLRFLSAHDIKIGINWYLTEDDGTTDGKFTDYLDRPDGQSNDRIYDPELFDALKEIAFRKDKTVQIIEEAKLIPGAKYYSAQIPTAAVKPATRAEERMDWFKNSWLMLEESELIFADPDNGISYRLSASRKGSEKYVLPEEVAEYYNAGKDVVFYCHKGRRKLDDWENAKIKIRESIRDTQILGLTYHRGSQRSYIFVVHPDHYRKYVDLLNEFENTAWSKLFSRENIIGSY